VTLDEFQASLSDANPPNLSPPLIALWHDARGEWDKAHNVAQDIDDENGSWVHAYLHRKEGDLGNAGYWYRQARRPTAANALSDEWKEIVATLLRENTKGRA